MCDSYDNHVFTLFIQSCLKIFHELPAAVCVVGVAGVATVDMVVLAGSTAGT